LMMRWKVRPSYLSSFARVRKLSTVLQVRSVRNVKTIGPAEVSTRAAISFFSPGVFSVTVTGSETSDRGPRPLGRPA